MSEAELRIKPTVTGSVAGELQSVRNSAEQLARTQERGIGRGERVVGRLGRTYDRLSRSVSRVRDGVRSAVDNIFSMRTAITGLATGVAGRTFWDNFIGPNVELEQQQITFNTLLGDVEKAEGLLGNIREFAASTPFAQGDLIQGSQRLLQHTQDNVDENERLLEVAANMAALQPERTVADAAQALTGAATGRLRGLRGFGINLSMDDVRAAQRDGEELGDAAVRAAVESFDELTDGEDLVGALSESFSGRLSTLRDNFRETMRLAGEPAFEAFSEGMEDTLARVEELRADPEFQDQMESFGEWMGDVASSVAEFAPTLIEKIPSAAKSVGDVLRRARNFYDRHPGLVKFLAGTVAVNHLTGGMVTSAAGGLLRSGAGALMGRGGRGGVGAAAAGMGKCCCPGGMGAGAGGAAGAAGRGGAAGRAAAAGGAAAGAGPLVGSPGAGAGAGGLAALGAGTVATGVGAAAVPAASAGGLLWAADRSWQADGTVEGGGRIAPGLEVSRVRTEMAQSIREGDDAGAARALINAMGGADAVFRGTDEEQNVMEAAQRAARGFGMDFEIEEGQTVGHALARTLGEDESWRRRFRELHDIEDDLDRGDAGEVVRAIREEAESQAIQRFMDDTIGGVEVRRALEEGDEQNLQKMADVLDIDMHFEHPPDDPDEMRRMIEEALRQMFRNNELAI